jgi:2-methylcitrate dehydratase PrpD
MAAVLIDRKLGVRQFTTERVMDPKVQELLKRVNFIHPPEYAGYEGMELNPEQVIVKLKNGTIYQHEVFNSKGTPGNRLSEAELTTKYRDCAGLAISPARIDRSLEMLRELEKLGDISELMDVLCAAEVSKQYA